REQAKDEEEVGVGRLRRDEELRRDRAGDLRLALERRERERDTVGEGVVRDAPLPDRRPPVESAFRVEVETLPARARERPLALGARHEALARVPDLEQHRRLLVPAVLLALQEAVEEAELKLPPVVGVEVRPVLAPVYLEPLLRRAGAHERLEVAPRVQAVTSPVAAGEERHVDAVPVGGP